MFYLYIASTEDNVLVDLIRRRDLFLWISLSAFRTPALDMLETDCRIGRIDLMKCADISKVARSQPCVVIHRLGVRVWTMRYLMSDLDIKEIREPINSDMLHKAQLGTYDDQEKDEETGRGRGCVQVVLSQ